MSGDPGHFMHGAFRHDDMDVAREYRTSMCTIYSLVQVGHRTLQSRGSGFLVRCAGQACVLTNAHVLPNREALARSTVTFIAPIVGCSSTVTLCPEKLFITSPKPRPDTCACKFEICTCAFAAKASALALDYTVCAIEADGLYFRKSVPVPLNGAKATVGTGIFFVHQVGQSLKCCKEQIESAEEFRILTLTSSFPGSSGSPVFNLDRELIGLHRAGGCASSISMEAMPAPAGIGKVIAPCLAVPARAIARNMRLQMSIRDLIDDILHSFLSDGASSESSAQDSESSSEDDKEWAHYAPSKDASPARPPRFLVAKWGCEFYHEKSATGSQLTVTRTLQDTQAARRLEVGDVIVTVNGRAVSGLDTVAILVLLQVARLSLVVDRLSPSVGFLTLLTLRRRLEVDLDTPQLMCGGIPYCSYEQRAREEPPRLDGEASSRPDGVGAAAEAMLESVVSGVKAMAAGGGGGEGGSGGVDGEEAGEEEGVDESQSGVQTEDGEVPAVLDAMGAPRFVLEGLGLELSKGTPGRLRVARVWKKSWCRAHLKREDELMAIAGQGLRGMRVSRVLELLHRDGVKVMVVRRWDADDVESEQVWTVALCAPAEASESSGGAHRKCRRHTRRKRVREMMSLRHGRSPVLHVEPADSGKQPGPEPALAAEEGPHVVHRWGLELEKGAPGRLRVAQVREDSMAKGRVRAGDEVLAVNRRSIRGRRIADVVEAMSAGVLLLAMEREGGSGGARVQVVEELHALKLAPPAPAGPQPPPKPHVGQVCAGARGAGLPTPATDSAKAASPAEKSLQRSQVTREVTRQVTRQEGRKGREGGREGREVTRPPRSAPEGDDTPAGTKGAAARSHVAHAQASLRLEQWGLELGRGRPGALRVCGVSGGGEADGRLQVGDELVAVNKRALKGMALTVVEEMFRWQRPEVTVERAVRKRALVDYWTKETLVVRLGAPSAEEEDDLRRAVQRMLSAMVDTAARNAVQTFAVPLWGMELGRGSPGRLRVASMSADSPVRESLRVRDEIVVVAGKGLRGMRVAEVLKLLDADRVVLSVERGGNAAAAALQVVLQAPCQPHSTLNKTRGAGGSLKCDGQQGSADMMRADGAKQAADARQAVRCGRSSADGGQRLLGVDQQDAMDDLVEPREQRAFDLARAARETVLGLVEHASRFAQMRADVSAECQVARWGVELARRVPGRLKVCRVRGWGSLAFGKLYENDDIVQVNGEGLKGRKLSDVMVALNRSPVRLTVDRAVGNAHADYWESAFLETVLVDPKQPEDPAAPSAAEAAAAHVLGLVLSRVAREESERFKVERWGVELQRGAPGRLRVCRVRQDSLALGALLERDQISAVDGKRLGRMPVGDAVQMLERARLALTVEREVRSEGVRRTEEVAVELQSWPARFKASPHRILGSAIEGLYDARRSDAHGATHAQGAAAEPRAEWVIQRWGVALGKARGGGLRVQRVEADSAARGKLLAGDEIAAVDGQALRGVALERVLEMLEGAGPALTVVRGRRGEGGTVRVHLAGSPLLRAPNGDAESTDKRASTRLSASAQAAAEVLDSVVFHAESIAKTRSGLEGTRSSTDVDGCFQVQRWGVRVCRGGPGRMLVLAVAPDGAAAGKLLEEDRMVLLNGVGLRGRQVAEVLAMLDVGTVRVTLERHTPGAGWVLHTVQMHAAPRPSSTHRGEPVKASRSAGTRRRQKARGNPADGKALQAAEARSVALQIVDELVLGAVQSHVVPRWGLELRRGVPGRLRVGRVKEDGIASGRLREGDEIVAVNGRELKGMKVWEVVQAMDVETVAVSVERQQQSTEVQLRSLQSFAAMVKLSLRALKGAAGSSPGALQPRQAEAVLVVGELLEDLIDAAVVRHSVAWLGLELRRGRPGRLTVSRVQADSVAREKLQVGDELASVNGRALKGATVAEALALLRHKRLSLAVHRSGAPDAEQLAVELEAAGGAGQEQWEGVRQPRGAASVASFLNSLAQRVAESTAPLTPAASKPAEAAAGEDKADGDGDGDGDGGGELDGACWDAGLCGEGIQLVRSSPSVITVQQVCSGTRMWRDLKEGDEIVAVNGQGLAEMSTCQVKLSMLTQAPVITLHRRSLDPPGTTFWKWMLPAQVLTVRLPFTEPNYVDGTHLF